MPKPELQKRLKIFLKSPRTLEDIALEFGCSPRSAIRYVNDLGQVWRVSPAGERECWYVYRPPWARRKATKSNETEATA